MPRRTSFWSGSLIAILVVSLALPLDADAMGGGHRGRAPRPPAQHSAHRNAAPRPSRMAHANNTGARPRVNNNRSNVHNNPAPHIANNTNANRNSAHPSNANRSAGITAGYAMYGVGSVGRHYNNRGYGRGYANRYYGNRSYGRSQSNDRSIVSRLRSVHASLARIDHDYRGHRVRAMRSISRAIVALAHRSISSRSLGFNGQANTRLAANHNGRVRQPLSQAQSDQRMSQALRTTQGITQQLSHQGYGSTNHMRARGHLQYAMHEMNVALTLR